MENYNYWTGEIAQKCYKFVFLCIMICLCLLIIKMLKNKIFGDKNKLVKINDTLQNSELSISKHPTGFIFGEQKGDVVYMKDTNEGHIVVFGGSGQGKTSALLIPSLRVWDGAFFCIDISGDINKNVDCKNKAILSPDDPENSLPYNVFYMIDKEEDIDERRVKIEELVNLVLPLPDKVNDTQKYFIETARTIFLASMIAFYEDGDDFVPICKKVFFTGTKDLYRKIEGTGNELAINYIQSIKGENEKNTNGAKSTLNNHIKLFADNKKIEKILRRPKVVSGFDMMVNKYGQEVKNEYEQEEACLNPSDLEDGQIFLVVPDKKQEYYQLFLNIVTGQVLDYIGAREFDKEKDKRILVALDEFASIGYLQILGPFRKFRKNGGNLCILTQSLADIDLVYSENERKAILDNCRYTVVLSANDNTTREYFSKLVGHEDVKKESLSISKHGDSKSVSIQKELAIEPEAWRDLKDDLIVIHPQGYVKLKKYFYFKH